jgi:hypothetical protein
MKNPTSPSSISDLLSKDMDTRAKDCKAAIDKALEDFNCSIEVAMVAKASGNSFLFQINANPPKR